MSFTLIGLFLLGTIVSNTHASGILPAVPAGIAYTRAIPYNIPPFAASVSFLRTGPKAIIAPSPAILPPHVHSLPRYSPLVPAGVVPHVHAAAPIPAFHHGYHGFGVPAVLPHAASVVPHVGVLPHAHALPVPAAVPAVAALPAPGVPVGIPHVHAAPAIAPAAALPHVHAHAQFAPVVTPHHAHLNHAHYHRR